MRPSGWTVDTLKQHVDDILAEREKAVEAALVAVKEEGRKTELAAEKRFDLLNELRQGVATKEQVAALEKEIATLSTSVTRIDAVKQGSTEMRVLISGAVLLAISVLAFLGFKL